MEETRVFDLSGLSKAAYPGQLRFKWWGNMSLMVFFLIGAGAIGARVLLNVLGGQPAGPSEEGLAFVALFGGFACFLYFSSNSRYRRPASKLELSSDALVVTYPSGARAVFPWNDPSFHLRINKFQSSALNMVIAHVLFWRYPRLLMPLEVAEAVESASREHGLTVTVVKDPNQPLGEYTLIRGPGQRQS